MFDDKTEKEKFLRKPDGKRKTGKPKSRWLDCTENRLILYRWCQEMVEVGSGQICMSYQAEGGTG
jgi:hypothetical protein